MNKIITPLRHERKYIVPQAELYRLNSFITGQVEPFVTHYPTRKINSIYFDGPNFKSIQQSLDGLTERAKFRLRWYNDEKKIQFENKIKNANNLGHKYIYPINDPQLEQHPLAKIINSIKVENLNDELILLLNYYPLATVEIIYQRQYYITPDQEIRLTIDTEISSKNLLYTSDTPTHYSKSLRPFAIIELKYADKHTKRVARICQNWPYRATSFSKYSWEFFKS